MKNRLLFIISFLVVCIIGIGNVYAADNEVSFNIGVDKVYNGIKFPVYININNKQDNVSAILFNMEYDPNKVEALIDDNAYNTQVVGTNSISSILSSEDKDLIYAYNNERGTLTFYSSLKNIKDNNIVIWFKPKQFTEQTIKFTVSDFELYEGDNNTIDNYTLNYDLSVNSGLGISDIKINNKVNKLIVGNSIKLTTKVLPVNTELSNETIWSSSNNKIATVDSKGTVIGHSPGIVNIKTRSINGVEDTDTIVVYLSAMKFNKVYNDRSNITLNWTPNNEVDGFLLYRKEGSGKYKLIAKLKGNVSKYVDKDVHNGRVYTYALKSYDGNSKSSFVASTIYRIYRPNITSLTNKKPKAVNIKYNKNSHANGYLIQYSTDSTFNTNAKVVTSKATSVNVNKLTKNKVYYFRVRSYYKYKGVKYYSAWSFTKSIKIKK